MNQLIVDAEISYRQAVKVQEELIRLWIALQIKVDNSFAQVVAACVQSQLEVVFKFGEEGRARLGFYVGQVHLRLVPGVHVHVLAQVLLT